MIELCVFILCVLHYFAECVACCCFLMHVLTYFISHNMKRFSVFKNPDCRINQSMQWVFDK